MNGLNINSPADFDLMTLYDGSDSMAVSKDRDTYRVRFSLHGKREQIRLPDHNKRQAEEVDRHIHELKRATLSGTRLDDATAVWVSKIGNGKLFDKLVDLKLLAPRNAEAAPVKLMEFVEEFVNAGRMLQDGRKASKGTLKRWYTSRDYVREHFGDDVTVENVTVNDAVQFRAFIEDQPGINSENTIRKHCQVAQMFFNAAIEREIIDKNPFRKVPTTSVQISTRSHFVTREEFDKCVAAAEGDRDWKLILYLTRVAGMRCPSEVLAARYSDIDWKNNRMVVHCKKTERHAGKETRVIPLWQELREVLAEGWEGARKGEDRIITRYESTNQNFRTHLKRLIIRAGVKPWPKAFNNLRASRVNELINRGVPNHVAAAWIGHDVEVQAKNYLHVDAHHFEADLAN